LNGTTASMLPLTRVGVLRLLLLCGLLALGVWIARNTYWEEVSVPGQARGEAATNPYYGLVHLAADLGLETRTVASLSSLPGRDGVLLLDKVGKGTLPRSQIQALEHWVEAGGRLILSGSVLGGSTELRHWTGIQYVPPRITAPGAAPSDGAAPNVPPLPPPRARVAIAAVRKDCPPMQVSIDGKPTGETLLVCDVWVGNGYRSERTPAWALSDAAGIQVLRVGLGRGSVTVIGPSQIYATAAVFEHQHARVFVDASPLLRGDQLWILVANQPEALLALLWRLGAPAIGCLIAAVLLSLWRSFPRFGPLAAAPPDARRSLAEQIRANARFAWRSHSLEALHAAALRGVEDVARRQIAAFDRLDTAQRGAVIAARAGISASALEEAMRLDTARRPPSGRSAIALLEQVRRRLQTQALSSNRNPA